MASYVKDKDKNQILEDMYGTAQPGSSVHEQQKMAIIVRCVEDFEKAIKESSESSNKLTKKVFYLNIILTIATIIGAVATAIMAYKQFLN